VPLGLDLGLRLDVTRRKPQSREMEDTVMNAGSTYLTLFVRLKNALTRLGRFLTQSTATKFVTGL